MLTYEANYNMSPRTMKRAMYYLDWQKYIACRRGWVSPDYVARLVNWVENALFLRPKPEDWDNIQFSDEIHAGFGTQGRMYIIRKLGTCYCPDCI